MADTTSVLFKIFENQKQKLNIETLQFLKK